MRSAYVILTLASVPQLAWADCVYTGAKRAYLECIYSETLSNAVNLAATVLDVFALDTRLDTVETDVGALQADAAALQSDVGDLQTDVGTLGAGLDALITSTALDIAAVAADVLSLDGRLGLVEDDLDALYTEVSGLQAGTTVNAANIVRSEGGVASGSNVNMLTLNLNLTGKAGHWIHIYGGTALAENGNTSNTGIIRLILDNNAGQTTTIAAQRQGIAVYSQVDWSANSTASLSAQGYFQIPANYAVANATIRLNGGIDGGSFYWGDQPSYTNFDGETAGAHLGYAVF